MRPLMEIGVLGAATAVAEMGEHYVYVGVMCLIGTVIVAYYVVSIWQMIRPETSNGERFQSKTECDKRCQENLTAHAEIIASFDGRLDKKSHYDSTDRKITREEISAIKQKLAAAEERDKAQERVIYRMESKIDSITACVSKK